MQITVTIFLNVSTKLWFILRLLICTSVQLRLLRSPYSTSPASTPSPPKKAGGDLDLILVKLFNLLELHLNTGTVKLY